MHIQNLIEIHKLIHKILSIAYTKFYQISFICSEDIEEKHIFTSIKGHNSVLYKKKLAHLQSQTTPP